MVDDLIFTLEELKQFKIDYCMFNEEYSNTVRNAWLLRLRRNG
jgi:hypothetical protein